MEDQNRSPDGHKDICDLWPWYGWNHGHRFDVDSSSEPSLHFVHGAQKHSTKSPTNVQSQHGHRGFGVACFVGSNPVNMFTATAVLIPLVVFWFPGKILGWKKRWERMQPKTQLVAKCFENLYMVWLSQTRGRVNEMARIILCKLLTHFLPRNLAFLDANFRLAMGWVADANRFGKDMGNQWIPLFKMVELRNLHLHFWWVNHDSAFPSSSMGLPVVQL